MKTKIKNTHTNKHIQQKKYKNRGEIGWLVPFFEGTCQVSSLIFADFMVDFSFRKELITRFHPGFYIFFVVYACLCVYF
jgi:hypothetical protein